MKDGYVLVYDFGTTAVKTALYRLDMQLADIIVSEIEYEFPFPGYVEIDPEVYWSIVLRTTTEIIHRNNRSSPIKAIGLASQAETVIPIDTYGKPARKAMVWLDTRARKECDYLSSLFSKEILHYNTGLVEMSSMWPVCKLLWIRDNEPQVFNRIWKYMLLKDYILYKLTGMCITDPTICCYTAYFDIRSRTWWNAMLEKIGVDAGILPEIRDSLEIAGFTTGEFTEAVGFQGEIKVMNGMLDQCASAVGAGNIGEGTVSETTGTVLAMAAPLGDIGMLHGKMIPVICHVFRDSYMALPYCLTAGIILKWFRDNFCLEILEEARCKGVEAYAILDKLAEGTSIDPDLIVLPHYNGCTSPVNNPDAKGMIYGLRLDTGKGMLVRAILESIAFLLRENIEFLEQSGFKISRVISTGGGANSPLWLQIKSDILGKPVITNKNKESTSMGCAFLTALVAGFYESPEDIFELVGVHRTYLPQLKTYPVYEEKYRLYRWIYNQLFCV